MQSDHADLLNALDDMQRSHTYAWRRDVLHQAELLIVRLEQENRNLKAAAAAKADYDSQS
jgi:hypothetical protein